MTIKTYRWENPYSLKLIEDVPEGQDSWAEIIGYGRNTGGYSDIGADYPIVHIHKMNLEVSPIDKGKDGFQKQTVIE